jgi:hypothetical protein
MASPSERYSFTGAIKAPHQVLQGGYLSWHDPVTDRWFQQKKLGGPEFVDLGILNAAGKSIRELINERTKEAYEVLMLKNEYKRHALSQIELVRKSTHPKAESWRKQIQELPKRKK